MKRLAVVVCGILAVALSFSVAAGQPAASVGLTVRQLGAEDLDAVEAETGYRVGVLVVQVKPNSAADNAGLKVGDLVLTCGESGVDSPAGLDAALRGQTGYVEILAFRQAASGEIEADSYYLEMPAATGPVRPEPGKSAPDEVARPEAKLAALDAALAAGIITADEHARKKAQLEAQMRPAGDPDMQQKLEALKAARDAGILTQEEYDGKKAALDAGAAAAAARDDEATRKKLAALEAAHEAGILSDAEFDAKKAQLLGAAAAPAASASAASGKGKTYRHPIGFTMWHPEGWNVVEGEGALQLTPPDPATQGGQPAELYFVTGESVAEDGITRSDDPQVTSYMNEQVALLAPQLRAMGVTGRIPLAHGSGTVMDWESQLPTGETVLARAYIAIVKQSGVSLIAIGQKGSVMAREPVLRKMFTSFSVDEGERDPAVVGTWSLVSTYALSNDSPFETTSTNARSVSETQNTLVIRADGTWHQTVVSQFIAMGASNPITGGTIVLDSGPEKKTYNGRWNAGNGVLYLMSQDDRYDDYQYKVRQGAKGRELVLVSGGKGEVWSE